MTMVRIVKKITERDLRKIIAETINKLDSENKQVTSQVLNVMIKKEIMSGHLTKDWKEAAIEICQEIAEEEIKKYRIRKANQKTEAVIQEKEYPWYVKCWRKVFKSNKDK
jgi:hypothetical protein